MRDNQTRSSCCRPPLGCSVTELSMPGSLPTGKLAASQPGRTHESHHCQITPSNSSINHHSICVYRSRNLPGLPGRRIKTAALSVSLTFGTLNGSIESKQNTKNGIWPSRLGRRKSVGPGTPVTSVHRSWSGDQLNKAFVSCCVVVHPALVDHVEEVFIITVVRR